MSAFALALAMAAAQPAQEPYRAQGNDPHWTLTIADGLIRFEPRGGPAIEVRAPSPRTSEFSRDYRTDRLWVSVHSGADGFLGYSRCNRFAGRYTRAGDRLTFSWIASTMSRCPSPHDAHELHLRRIFSGAAGPVRFSLSDAETLLLIADVTIRLRRIAPND